MEAAYPDNPMLAEDLISKYLFYMDDRVAAAKC